MISNDENNNGSSSSKSEGTDLSSANMDVLMGTVTNLIKDISMADTLRRTAKTESASQPSSEQLMPIQKQLQEIAGHLADIKQELQQMKEQKKEKGWFF
ncbi:hypothetical protein [Bacillus marinisedimentorum]|uniref:hypothetical protein n=1 Tax=Bacillus marinisedimentorum TaxID=1821260 RepID=UPI000872A136|nr:hypothetical protein [Bacillus marinisedimentorum]